ncbi:nucleotidyltransferase family protein [Albidovulum sp.]
MSGRPREAMLFAAGLGTRMGALTAHRPKPLVEVGGRALIDHALEQIDNAGIGRVVVNVHYLGAQIRAHLAHRPDIVISDETETILETGGGLKKAAGLFAGGAVVTLNSDAVWRTPTALRGLVDRWQPAGMACLALLVPRAQALGHRGGGDFDLGADGRIRRGRDFVFTGAQVVVLDEVTAEPGAVFSFNRVWDRLIADGRMFGAVHEGGWCDVGHPEALPLAERLLGGAGDV